jgi:hypothetical protein
MSVTILSKQQSATTITKRVRRKDMDETFYRLLKVLANSFGGMARLMKLQSELETSHSAIAEKLQKMAGLGLVRVPSDKEKIALAQYQLVSKNLPSASKHVRLHLKRMISITEKGMLVFKMMDELYGMVVW